MPAPPALANPFLIVPAGCPCLGDCWPHLRQVLCAAECVPSKCMSTPQSLPVRSAVQAAPGGGVGSWPAAAADNHTAHSAAGACESQQIRERPWGRPVAFPCLAASACERLDPSVSCLNGLRDPSLPGLTFGPPFLPCPCACTAVHGGAEVPCSADDARVSGRGCCTAAGAPASAPAGAAAPAPACCCSAAAAASLLAEAPHALCKRSTACPVLAHTPGMAGSGWSPR